VGLFVQHEEQRMAKDQIDNIPDDDALNEKDLDQYGVWVKPETSGSQDDVDSDASLLDLDESLQEGNNGDSLDDLNDLLLGIDDEGNEDETIYLEEDDLSLDLESDTRDLMIEPADSQDMSGMDSIPDFDIPTGDGEEIILSIDDDDSFEVPAADNLETNLDSLTDDDTTLDNMFDDALTPPLDDELDLDESLMDSINDDNSLVIDTSSPSETGLPEIIENDLDLDLPEDEIELNLDLTEESTFDLDSAELPTPEINFDIDEEITDSLDLPEPDDDTELSLGSDMIDILMDNDDSSFDINEMEDGHLPGTEAEEKLFNDNLIETNSQENVPEFESPTNDADNQGMAFDDVAAVADEMFDGATARATPVANPASNSLLEGITRELQAIRSELADLRSSLQRTREAAPALSIAEPAISDIEVHEAQPASDLSLSDNEDDAASKPKGFFEDDEDETIALTGDELDNILNSAEFTEEAGQPTLVDEENSQLHDGDTSIDSFVSETMGSMPASTKADTEDEAFENSFSNSSPIEEISLEEIDNESDNELLLSDDEFEQGEAPTDAGSLADPFAGDSEEIEHMANLDIEKELAGIADLQDNESDMELLTDDQLDTMEIEIPDNIDLDQSPLDSDIEQVSFEEEPDTATTSSSNTLTTEMPVNIKSEIKAVLSYMDQLLDALPQEKIAEFAKSEHFGVYKKLFEELGL